MSNVSCFCKVKMVSNKMKHGHNFSLQAWEKRERGGSVMYMTDCFKFWICMVQDVCRTD